MTNRKVENFYSAPAVSEAETASERLLSIDCIMSNCIRYDLQGDEPWWDTAIAPSDIGAYEVERSVAYLDIQRLLIRHEDFPQWIRLRRAITALDKPLSFISSRSDSMPASLSPIHLIYPLHG